MKHPYQERSRLQGYSTLSSRLRPEGFKAFIKAIKATRTDEHGQFRPWGDDEFANIEIPFFDNASLGGVMGRDGMRGLFNQVRNLNTPITTEILSNIIVTKKSFGEVFKDRATLSYLADRIESNRPFTNYVSLGQIALPQRPLKRLIEIVGPEAIGDLQDTVNKLGEMGSGKQVLHLKNFIPSGVGRMGIAELESYLLHAYSGKDQQREQQRLKEAMKSAQIYHEGKYRKVFGFPYYIHVLRTAFYAHKAGAKLDTIIAALLHDAPEEYRPTPEDAPYAGQKRESEAESETEPRAEGEVKETRIDILTDEIYWEYGRWSALTIFTCTDAFEESKADEVNEERDWEIRKSYRIARATNLKSFVDQKCEEWGFSRWQDKQKVFWSAWTVLAADKMDGVINLQEEYEALGTAMWERSDGKKGFGGGAQGTLWYHREMIRSLDIAARTMGGMPKALQTTLALLYEEMNWLEERINFDRRLAGFEDIDPYMPRFEDNNGVENRLVIDNARAEAGKIIQAREADDRLIRNKRRETAVRREQQMSAD